MQNDIIYSNKPNMSNLPGGWEPDLVLDHANDVNIYSPVKGAFVIDKLIAGHTCDRIVNFFSRAPSMQEVSVQGMAKEGAGAEIGSRRVTAWSPELAHKLWQLFTDIGLDADIQPNKFTPTDWWHQAGAEGCLWKPVGFSPMMRFMRYGKGGQHYAHYDSGFIYDNADYRTLMSVVVYLTSAGGQNGGSTRFIEDGQSALPVYERNHADWSRPVKEEEVLSRVFPKKGRVLIFPHRMCHDVEKYVGEEDRIIIRTDLVYKAIG